MTVLQHRSWFSARQAGLAICSVKVGILRWRPIRTGAQGFLEVHCSALTHWPGRSDTVFTRCDSLHAPSQGSKCLVALGQYPEALPLFAVAEKTFRHLVAQDPQDSRALADLQVVLNDKALGFEVKANPDLSAADADKRANLVAAEKVLTEAVVILEKLLKDDPSNQNWKSVLADAQVRLGTIQSILRIPGDHQTLARKGLATLRDMGKDEQASPMTLDSAANAFLKIEPGPLRDSGLAVSFAEREVAQSHGRRPSLLLTLSLAYRASGQPEKGRVTALKGLALLPATESGSAKPNIRKLLEIQAQRQK